MWIKYNERRIEVNPVNPDKVGTRGRPRKRLKYEMKAQARL